MGSTTHQNTSSLPNQTNQPPTTFKMSAPNANKPNEGIVGQIGNSLNNAAQYVSETVQGTSATASKEQAKGNTADDSISGRVSGAMGAASDKMDEKKHDTSAEANKRSI